MPRIVKLEVSGSLRTRDFIMNCDNDLTVITGPNGVGKSSILDLLSPYPPVKREFKDGFLFKKITFRTNNGLVEISYDNDKCFFTLNGIEQNRSSKRKEQILLVETFFNIKKKDHDVCRGLIKFTDMSHSNRKVLLTEMSDTDYNLVVGIYKGIKDELTAVNANISLVTENLVKNVTLNKNESETLVGYLSVLENRLQQNITTVIKTSVDDDDLYICPLVQKIKNTKDIDNGIKSLEIEINDCENKKKILNDYLIKKNRNDKYFKLKKKIEDSGMENQPTRKKEIDAREILSKIISLEIPRTTITFTDYKNTLLDKISKYKKIHSEKEIITRHYNHVINEIESLEQLKKTTSELVCEKCNTPLTTGLSLDQKLKILKTNKDRLSCNAKKLAENDIVSLDIVKTTNTVKLLEEVIMYLHVNFISEKNDYTTVIELIKDHLSVLIGVNLAKTQLNVLSEEIYVVEDDFTSKIKEIDEQLFHAYDRLSYMKKTREDIDKVILYNTKVKNDLRKSYYNSVSHEIDKENDKISKYNSDIRIKIDDIKKRLNEDKFKFKLKVRDENTLAKLLESKKNLSECERILNPKDGLVAKSIQNFINNFIYSVNAKLKEIYAYRMEIIPYEYSDDDDELLLSFRVKTDKNTIPDIGLVSSGMKDAINLAVVLTYNEIRKIDYPISLDEFGRTFDSVNRENIPYIIRKIPNQKFIVSHFIEDYINLQHLHVVLTH